MNTNRTLMLIDGENILSRFEEMVSNGKEMKSATKHKKGTYVWHPTITTGPFLLDIIRVSYYTTIVGSYENIEEVKNEIHSIRYEFRIESLSKSIYNMGYVCPHIFKKERQSSKNKSVDINICIDALRHTYNNSIDNLYLFSGDGDYIPLVQEVMRQGKRVFVGALSSGLNPQLRNEADEFIDLDVMMFS